MSQTAAPRLSIIVAPIRPGDGPQPVLCDLARRGSTRGVEVIFVERVSDAAPSERAGLLDGVVRVGAPETATLPRLLGTAFQHARGEIIAITDTLCELDDRWADTLLQVHESADPVIGGSVEPGELRGLVDWAAYLTDYGQFMLPLTEGVATELPGNNISMKRWALERGQALTHGEFWKTYWCRQLQADGLNLRMAPQLTVRYRCVYDLWPFLVRRFHHGRCFAGMRLRQLSGIKRIVYLAGAPALPVVLLARTFRAVLPKRRCVGKLLLAMPMIFLATLSWALGELVGYTSGSGESCKHVR
jgi:hypothetical protein